MIDVQPFLAAIRQSALAAGVFADVTMRPDGVHCTAKDAAAEAVYSICRDGDGDGWLVRLATPDRWLSESIEADLMHYGDPIEELVEEELVELGHEPARDGDMPTIKHFRSDDRRYTFENRLPLPADTPSAAAVASRFLLAYEAAFRELGDMQPEGDMQGGGDE